MLTLFLGLTNIRTLDVLYFGHAYSKTAYLSIERGISDERAHYPKIGNWHWSLRPNDWFMKPERHIDIMNPERYAEVNANLGKYGLSQGPSFHLVDGCALTDPLLSHLPIQHTSSWRIGHFWRELPAGYVESLQKNTNLLVDARIHDYYEVIRSLTRAPLNDLQRLKNILRMNLGYVRPPTIKQ